MNEQQEEEVICLVYVDPDGIDDAVLSSLKAKIFNGSPSDEGISSWAVTFREASLPYRDLLAMARATNLQAECFFILNKDTADKGAVLCVQTEVYTDVKGIGMRRTSAATARRLYLAPEEASSLAVNLSIANSDFEETACDYGPAELKRGVVRK